MAIYTRNKEGKLIPLKIPAIKGEPGKQGPQGLPGRDGVDGKDGKNGIDGTNGQDGADGVTPDIKIGTVTTLEPNQQATVTKRGTKEEPIFDFGIPKGEKGVDGVGGESSIQNNKRTLLAEYEHTHNKVIIPKSLNLETGIYTTSGPHNLKDNDKLLLFVKDNVYFNFDVRKIPKELWQFDWITCFFPVVIVVSETEFKLKHIRTNAEIKYSTSPTDNGSLEFGEWGFQVAQDGILFNNGDFSKYKTLILDMYIPNMNLDNYLSPDVFNVNLNKNNYTSFPYIPERIGRMSSQTYRELVYKNTYYTIKFTIEENLVRQEVLRSTIGVKPSYRYMHPDLLLTDSAIFIDESYTDNVTFKNNIKLLSTNHKFLNGTKIKIFGEGEV